MSSGPSLLSIRLDLLFPVNLLVTMRCHVSKLFSISDPFLSFLGPWSLVLGLGPIGCYCHPRWQWSPLERRVLFGFLQKPTLKQGFKCKEFICEIKETWVGKRGKETGRSCNQKGTLSSKFPCEWRDLNSHANQGAICAQLHSWEVKELQPLFLLATLVFWLAADSIAFLNQMTSLSLMAEFSALSIGSICYCFCLASFLNCPMQSPVV